MCAVWQSLVGHILEYFFSHSTTVTVSVWSTMDVTVWTFWQSSVSQVLETLWVRPRGGVTVEVVVLSVLPGDWVI